MGRYPAGSGHRPQRAERARTIKRKIEHKAAKWANVNVEELKGICEGIMCDKRINYIEAPYYEAAKRVGGTNAKLDSMRRKVRKAYNIDNENTAGWERFQYKNRPRGKHRTH